MLVIEILISRLYKVLTFLTFFLHKHKTNIDLIFSGEVLIVEEPYATVLYPQFYASHCMQCFTRIIEDPQSCSGCQEVILLTLCSFVSIKSIVEGTG